MTSPHSDRPTHIEVDTPAPGDGEVVSAAAARQASPGRRILMVLVVSLGAAIVVLGAYWLANAHKLQSADIRSGIDHGQVASAPAAAARAPG